MNFNVSLDRHLNILNKSSPLPPHHLSIVDSTTAMLKATAVSVVAMRERERERERERDDDRLINGAMTTFHFFKKCDNKAVLRDFPFM